MSEPRTVDQTLEDLRQRKDCSLRPSCYLTDRFMPIPPHKVGVAHLMLKRRLLLADPTGCGKTPQALVAYGVLKDRDRSLRMVVATEKSALFQWKGQVEKFLDGVETEVIGYDDRKKPLTKVARYEQYTRQPDILIGTYQILAQDLAALQPTLPSQYIFVLDEVQKVRNRRQRLLFPMAKALGDPATYCWGLSATPIMNRVEDIFAIMAVVAPGVFPSWSAFAEAFLRRSLETVWLRGGGKRKVWKVHGPKNLPILMDTLRPWYLKRPAHEITQYLPEVVTQNYDVDLDVPQAAAYRAILDESFNVAKASRMEKIVALLRAQQMADVPAVLIETLPSAKWETLKDLLTDRLSGQQVLVYCRFAQALKWLSAQMTFAGLPHGMIIGEVKAQDRDAIKEAFQAGTLPTLLLNAAGGQALDLQAANCVVFFDLPWSYGEYLQVLGRARRIGSKHDSILAIHLLAEIDGLDATIDDLLLATLERKQAVVQATFGTPDEEVLVPEDGAVIDALFDRMREQARAQKGAKGESV